MLNVVTRIFHPSMKFSDAEQLRQYAASAQHGINAINWDEVNSYWVKVAEQNPGTTRTGTFENGALVATVGCTNKAAPAIRKAFDGVAYLDAKLRAIGFIVERTFT